MTQEQTERPDVRRIGRWAWIICSVLVALMLGFLAGYYLRSTTDRPVGDTKPALSSAPPQTGASVPPSPSAFSETAVSQTRHWKGDSQAPVTIVEFGDFQ